MSHSYILGRAITKVFCARGKLLNPPPPPTQKIIKSLNFCIHFAPLHVLHLGRVPHLPHPCYSSNPGYWIRNSVAGCSMTNNVGFEGLTAVSMKMAVFWVVMLCSLVEVYQCVRGSCCLHHQGNESENFYQTTWHYNLEDSHLLEKQCFLERMDKWKISVAVTFVGKILNSLSI
jgi:hypothetical protein